MLLKDIINEDHAQKIIAHQRKARKKVSGYGQLGTKYNKHPKYRDKPRNKRVRDFD